jgi:ribosome-binding protein aMBF1 (putative translation factor)
MTPERFTECLTVLRWSQRSLADMLGRDESTVRRWAAGTYPVPSRVEGWLERLARAHGSNPPPVLERTS